MNCRSFCGRQTKINEDDLSGFEGFRTNFSSFFEALGELRELFIMTFNDGAKSIDFQTVFQQTMKVEKNCFQVDGKRLQWRRKDE
jgi:hypothetical protein